MLLLVNAGPCDPVSQGSVLCEWGVEALGLLSWESIRHHLHDCFLRTLQLGLPQCVCNLAEPAPYSAFLLLKEGRSADKIRTRLEGQRERNFHSGACRYLRAAQQWMQLSFMSSFPSWRSPILRTRVSGSQVFTNLPAALEWVIPPRIQFPISWMRETGLAPEHLFQTEVQCQSVDKWLRGTSYRGCWGCN